MKILSKLPPMSNPSTNTPPSNPSNNPSNNPIKLIVIPETSEDIYVLYKIIREDSEVTCLSDRKIVIGNKSKRITFKPTLLVLKVEPDLYSSVLLIKGTIQSIHEDIKRYSHHSLSISLNSKVVIETEYLTNQNIKDLYDSKDSINNSGFVLIEIKQNILESVKINIIRTIKYIPIKYKKNELEDSINIIKNHYKNYEIIIFYGLINKLKNIHNDKNWLIIDKKYNSYKDLITNKNIKEFIKNKNINNELDLYNRVINNNNNKIVYGYINILDYINRIDNILIVDYMARDKLILDRFIIILENRNIKYKIISSMGFVGENLIQLGGIIGLLR
eukprot:GHVP01047658.1.p1 GENE.GHVP01047658.1~~GHVP01047658.1.p1  ORF type:complete len:332 (-),score=33.33 GHVP01047658.1:56-1051(-)